jgi:hypothetical protein
MLIQVIKEYILLSKDNSVPPFLCEWESEHGLVYPNLDYDDRIYLYCLACDYKNYVGTETYELMKNLILMYNQQNLPD